MRLFRIIYDEPGQTCNRFWSYLESVSWAVFNKRKVHIIFWDPSIRDYDKIRQSKYVSFPFYKTRLINKYGEFVYLEKLRRIFGSEKAHQFYRSWIGRHIGFIDGWRIRESDVFFPQVRDKVVPLFKPNHNVINAVDSLFEQIRNNCDILVGVHIRLGDYREWKEGKYFFPHEVYASFMRQIEHLFANKTVAFYIASNEPVPTNGPFDAFQIYYGAGGAAEDLYALQLCDYIIGPPSTFSKWASIMGATPLHIIYGKNESITSIDDFSPLVSHTKFQNGKVVW